jgi:hypothetical protein
MFSKPSIEFEFNNGLQKEFSALTMGVGPVRQSRVWPELMAEKAPMGATWLSLSKAITRKPLNGPEPVSVKVMVEPWAIEVCPPTGKL